MDYPWEGGETQEREEGGSYGGNGGYVAVEGFVEGISKIREII